MKRSGIGDYLRVLPYRVRWASSLKDMFAWNEWHKRYLSLRDNLGARGLEPTGEETVVFLICLVAKDACADWDKVNALLADTLTSLKDQTDPNWAAVICGQDRPDVMPDDPRVTYLPFERGPGETDTYDKRYKLVKLHEWVVQTYPETGYGVILDGDDVLSKRFVAFVRSNKPKHGIAIPYGFSLTDDGKHGRYLAPGSWVPFKFRRDPFFRNCGSSVGVFFDGRDGGVGYDVLKAMMLEHHRLVPLAMHILGRDLLSVPFPAAVYRILHGQNDYRSRSMPPKLANRHLDVIRKDFDVLARVSPE